MFILFLLLKCVFAGHWDLNYNLQGRNYQMLGVGAYVDTGYNSLLWGEGNPRQSPLYGFIRTKLLVDSSIVVNQAEASISIYPVSFLGIERGMRYVKSDFEDFAFYDCDITHCKAQMRKDFIRYRAALSFFGIAASAEITQSNNSYSTDPRDESFPVAEFRYIVLAGPGSDKVYSSRYVLGTQALGGFIGAVTEWSLFSESEQVYHSNYLIYQFQSEKTRYAFGFGNLMTSHMPADTAFYFRITHIAIPSLLLF